jgi:methyl-accepting chemotaxis protein WspA
MNLLRSNHWTIRSRILASFAVVLGLMVVMGLLALRDLRIIDDRATDAGGASVPGLYYSTQVLSELIINYSLTAEYMGQTDVLRLETIEQDLSANASRWSEALVKLEALPENVAEQRKLDVFLMLRSQYEQTQKEVLRRSSELDTQGAIEVWRERLGASV